MFPFRIGPAVSTVIITVAISAAILGLVWVAGELHRGGRAEADAEHAESAQKATEQAARQAQDAQTAREAAFKTGSLGRLRADFCRDCQ